MQRITQQITILDLSNEILLDVFSHLRADWIGRCQSLGTLRRKHYFIGSLLTCRQFYHLVTPLIWTSVFLQDSTSFGLFSRALTQRPECGRLIQNFHLRAGDERLKTKFADWVNTDGEKMNFYNWLQSILEKLPNLRCLDIATAWTEGSSTSDWLLDLDCLPELEYLHASGFCFKPSDVDGLSTLRQLKHVDIIQKLSHGAWRSALLLNKINAQSLLLNFLQERSQKHARANIPNRIIRGFLSTFTNLRKLELKIPGGCVKKHSLVRMLKGLETNVKSLALEIDKPFNLQQSEMDFSNWCCLENLSFDSALFWPMEDNWDMRNKLYETLPSTLQSLRIHFPYAWHNWWSGEPYDGIFHLNLPESEDEDYSDFEEDREELCSHGHRQREKYTWLLNFLGCSPTDHGEPERRFPHLKNIQLSEGSGASNDHSRWELPHVMQECELPKEIDDKFKRNNVTIRALTSNFHYESCSSAEE